MAPTLSLVPSVSTLTAREFLAVVRSAQVNWIAEDNSARTVCEVPLAKGGGHDRDGVKLAIAGYMGAYSPSEPFGVQLQAAVAKAYREIHGVRVATTRSHRVVEDRTLPIDGSAREILDTLGREAWACDEVARIGGELRSASGEVRQRLTSELAAAEKAQVTYTEKVEALARLLGTTPQALRHRRSVTTY